MSLRPAFQKHFSRFQAMKSSNEMLWTRKPCLLFERVPRAEEFDRSKQIKSRTL